MPQQFPPPQPTAAQMTEDVMPWVIIGDFSAGISELVSPNHPLGAATSENTYGCVAKIGGGLHPLPTTVPLQHRLKSYLEVVGDIDTDIYITGLQVSDPVYSIDTSNRTDPGPDQGNTDLYVSCEWYSLTERNQVLELTLDGPPTGGSIVVELAPVVNGVTGAVSQVSIAYNANQAAVDAAFESIIGAGNVTTSLSGNLDSGNTATITITNGSKWQYGVSSEPLTPASAKPFAVLSMSQGPDDLNHFIFRYTLSRENPVIEHIQGESRDTLYLIETRPKPCDMATGRSNSPDPTQAGPIVMGMVYDGYARIFPDDVAPAYHGWGKMAYSDGTAAEDQGLVGSCFLVLHQGRAVIFPLAVVPFGQKAVYTNTEAMFWTEVNDFKTLDEALEGEYFKMIAGYENPTGYSIMASLTADQLLLIKGRGGALVIQGSLNDPVVITMPNVKSPGQSLNRGCHSSIGFMYPCDGGGIWMWTGSELSEFLSLQMDTEFWRPDYSDSPFGTDWTSMAQWQEWVALPNNWLLDTKPRGQSPWPVAYWRIEDPEADPAIIYKWAVDWKGRHAWGTPQMIDRDDAYNNSPCVFAYDYDNTTERSEFSWQSQPLPSTVNRIARVEDAVLVASGTGTVTLEVFSNFTDDDPVIETFYITPEEDRENVPIAIRGRVACQGSNIQCRIRSYGVGDQPAPTVHELRLQMNTEQEIQRPTTYSPADEFSSAFSSAFS